MAAPRRDFWLGHLHRWREQGGTLKAYAEANELSVTALYAAKRKYEKPASEAVLSATLLPVRVSPDTRSEAIRVSLPNGVRLEVPSGLSAAEWAPLMMLFAAS